MEQWNTTESFQEKIQNTPAYKLALQKEIQDFADRQKVDLNVLSQQKFWAPFDEKNSKHLLEMYTHLYMAENGKSIQDYLSQKNLGYTFSERKNIFQQFSKESYTGTSVQNMQLYRYLIHNYELNSVLTWVSIIWNTQQQLARLQDNLSNTPPSSYTAQREFTPQDILNTLSQFEANSRQKLPEDLKTFLQKYKQEAETYSWKEKTKQEAHGGLANVMSHNYAAQFIASLVYSWLPETVSIEQRMAISSLIAWSSLLWKEIFVDQKVTVSDVSIPVYVDLWDGNNMWFTFAPNGNISTEFRLNNIEKLSQKASEYVSTAWLNFTQIHHGNDKKWTGTPTENILQVSVGMQPLDLINIFQTIQKTPDNDKNIALLQDLSQKYGIKIHLEDIQRLGPMYTLQTFAIVNKDLLWPQMLMQLWIQFQWGKILLPKDLNISDPNIFMRMSIWWKLGLQLHTDRWGITTGDVLLNDVFAQLNIWISEKTEVEVTAWMSLLLWPIAKIWVKHEIQRDAYGNITSIIVEWWIISKELAIWLWFQNIDTSGQWSKIVFSLTATGWYGVTYGNVSKVFWDTQTSTSLFFSKVIPMLSTMEIQNPWVNVTKNWDTFWKLDNVLQTIITTPESRELANDIKNSLHILSEHVGIDMDGIMSYIKNIGNLRILKSYLENNQNFIIENKSQIRYLVVVWHRWSFESYDENSQILNLNPFYGMRKIDENMFKKTKHNFSNNETMLWDISEQQVSSQEMELSQTSLQEYFSSQNIEPSLKTSVQNILSTLQVIWFEKASEGEKKWFIQFLLRTFHLGQSENLRYKRIHIIDNSWIGTAANSQQDKKTITLQKNILQQLWNENLDYTQLNHVKRLWLESGNKNTSFLSMMEWWSEEQKKVIYGLLMDISHIDFVETTDPKVVKKNNFSSEYTGNTDEYLPFHAESGVLYISNRVWRGGYGFDKVVDMLRIAKSKNITQLDNVLSQVTSRKAQMVKIQRNAWSKQFYEFRPSSEITRSGNIFSVHYDIFDHGNKKLQNIWVRIDNDKKEIQIQIWDASYLLEHLVWKPEYEHIVLALTGMTGANNTWKIITIWWIIEQMFQK